MCVCVCVCTLTDGVKSHVTHNLANNSRWEKKGEYIGEEEEGKVREGSEGGKEGRGVERGY